MERLGSGVEDDFIDAESDVNAAIRFVLGTRRHLRKAGAAAPGCAFRGNFILKHQIYCIVENIAEVDECVEAMCTRNVLRKFCHPSYPRDVMLMFTDDYIHDINVAFDYLVRSHAESDAAQAASASGTVSVASVSSLESLRAKYLRFIQDCRRSAFPFHELRKSFDKSTYIACTEVVVEPTGTPAVKRARLAPMESTDTYSSSSRSNAPQVRGESTFMRSELASHLFKGVTQFLLSKVDVSLHADAVGNSGSATCNFTHPMMGEFLKYISDTRAALPRTIKRHSHNEVMECKLVSKMELEDGQGGTNPARALSRKSDMIPCKTSPYGWQYHLYDMLGNETIYKTPSSGSIGPFIKLK